MRWWCSIAIAQRNLTDNVHRGAENILVRNSSVYSQPFQVENKSYMPAEEDHLMSSSNFHGRNHNLLLHVSVIVL
jgi:hypothetical protein